MKRDLIFALLLPCLCYSQVRITGRIINEINNTPISAASVFLNNVTVCNKTNDEGNTL